MTDDLLGRVQRYLWSRMSQEESFYDSIKEESDELARIHHVQETAEQAETQEEAIDIMLDYLEQFEEL